MGYEDCTTISTVISASQPVTVLVHPIDPEEYGKLRKKYLPKGGVIQEGASLNFLSTQYTFYTGPGFVMCAAPKTPDLLLAAEYLGDTEVIPGVLCALGYAMGSFRVPGATTPFAMICPFRKDSPRPSYFGLSFD